MGDAAWLNHWCVATAGRSFPSLHAWFSTCAHTPVRDHSPALSVGPHSPVARTSTLTWSPIWASRTTSASSVTKSLPAPVISLATCCRTLTWSHFAVTTATTASSSQQTYSDICAHTLGWNPTSVKSVTGVLPSQEHWPNTWERTRMRNRMSANCVGSSSKSQGVWRDTWEFTVGSGLMCAPSVDHHSPVPVSSPRTHTSTVVPNRLSVKSVMWDSPAPTTWRPTSSRIVKTGILPVGTVGPHLYSPVVCPSISERSIVIRTLTLMTVTILVRESDISQMGDGWGGEGYASNLHLIIQSVNRSRAQCWPWWHACFLLGLQNLMGGWGGSLSQNPNPPLCYCNLHALFMKLFNLFILGLAMMLICSQGPIVTY